MARLRLVSWFGCLILLSLWVRSSGDFLSDYLDDKTFGPNPGPCVNRGDCDLNLNPPFSFPTGVAGIEVCLFRFSILGFGFQAFCQTVDEWVQGGFAQIWNVQCSNLGVKDIRLQSLISNPDRERSRIVVEDALQECQGSLFFENLKLAISIPVAFRFFLFFSEFLILEATATSTFTTRKNVADPNGIDVQFDIEFQQTTTTFPLDLPDQIEIIQDSCSINLASLSQGRGLGLRLALGNFGQFQKLDLYASNSPGIALPLNYIVGEGLFNLIIYIFEVLFSGVVCQIIEQGATTNSGQPGILNVVLDDALNLFYNDIKGSPDNIQNIHNQYFQNAQFSSFPALDKNQLELSKAIDFDSSTGFEIVTVTLNDWLGSGSPRLVVNEAIDLLTDPDGTVVFDLVQEAVDLGVELPLYVSNVGASLQKIQASSVNTISTFNILQRIPNTNGAGGSLNHGLSHSFQIDELFIGLRIGLELKRGEWVTISSCGRAPFNPACTADSSSFSFDFTLLVRNVQFNAQTLSLLNPAELNDVKIGQIFGRDLSQDVLEPLKESVKCAAPALYGFNITTLSAAVGLIDKTQTTVSGFSDNSLTALINDAKDLILTLFESIFSVHLEGIFNGIVRNAINEFLLEFVTLPADSSQCQPYTPGVGTAHLTFDSVIMTAVFRVINDVLGAGSAGTNADINDAVQVLLEYFSNEIALFPVEATGVQGAWVAKPEYQNFIGLTAFSESFPVGDAFMNVTNFRLTNVNTVNTLSAAAIGSTGFGVDFGLGDQANSKPLDIEVDFFIKVDRDNILEQFTVSFELDFDVELDFTQFLIDTNKINELTFGQLSHLPCIGSVLDGVVSSKDSIVLNNFDFDIVLGPTPSPSPAHPLSTAIGNLKTELNGPDSIQLRSMVTTVLSNSLTKIVDEVEAFDPTSTPANCSTKDNPLESLVGTLLGINIPNLTALVDTCLATPAPVESTAVSEARIVGFNSSSSILNMSNIGAFFNTAIDAGSLGATLQQVLRTLANATGNALSDLLVLEDDLSVTFELDISQPNFLFNLTGFQGFHFENDVIIPGLILELNTLRVKGLQNLLNDFKILDPKSTFITSYRFAFSDVSPLEVELNGFFQSDASFNGGTLGAILREDFLLEFKLDELIVAFDVLFAFNFDSLLAKSLGHLFTVEPGTQAILLAENGVDCLVELLFENGFYLPFLNISLGNIDDVAFTAPNNNLLSVNLEQVINELVKLVISFYVDALPNICQNCIRQFINDAFVTLQRDSSNCPTDPYPLVLPPEDQLFRFSTSPDLARLQTILNDFFYEGGTFGLWNTFMDGLTKTPLLEENPVGIENINLVYQGVDYGRISFSIQNILFENLDTFTSVDIVRPKGAPEDYSSFSGLEITGPLGVEFELRIDAENVFKGFELLRNEIRLKFLLEDVFLLAEIMLQVNVTKAHNLRFSSIASLQQIPCILVPVNRFELPFFNFSTSSIGVELDCVGRCDVPAINNLQLGGGFVSNNGEEVSNLVNDLITFSVRFLNSVRLQEVIDNELKNAELNCDQILCLLLRDCLADAGPEDNVAVTLGYLALGATLLTCGAAAVIVPLHRKRRKERVMELISDRHSRLTKKQRLKFEHEEISSIFAHPRTPILAKILLPLMCCANIALLVLAIGFSDALSLVISFSLGGATTNEVTLVPFTLTSLINDMWNSGAWPLSLLLLAASCAWPVIKNCLMILVWFLPTTILIPEYRVAVLQWLDVLGKWSFLEAFVIVASIAALKTFVDISTQDRLSFIPANLLLSTVELVPERGITLLAFVASSSLIVNHIMTIYHHRVVKQVFINESKILGQPIKSKPIANKRANLDHSKVKLHGLKKISPKAVRVLLIATGFSWFFLLLGTTLPLITFEVNGVVGQFLGLIDQKLRIRTFSIVQIGVTIYDYEVDDDLGRSFSNAFFQILFFATCFVAPLLQALLNFAVIKARLTLREHTRVLRAAQILSYWAALECFFVGVIGMVIELELIIDYVADVITFDVCSNVEPILVSTLGSADGSCIKIDPILLGGFACLFFGVAGQMICSLITFTLASAAIERRKVEGRHGDNEQSVPKFVRLKILEYFTIHHETDTDGPVEVPHSKRNPLITANPGPDNARPVSLTAAAIAKLKRMRERNPLRQNKPHRNRRPKSRKNETETELRTINPMAQTSGSPPPKAKATDPFPLWTRRRDKRAKSSQPKVGKPRGGASSRKKSKEPTPRERFQSEESIIV